MWTFSKPSYFRTCSRVLDDSAIYAMCPVEGPLWKRFASSRANLLSMLSMQKDLDLPPTPLLKIVEIIQSIVEYMLNVHRHVVIHFTRTWHISGDKTSQR